jgi:hypothetical protein
VSPELHKLKLALELRVGFRFNTIYNCKKLDEWLKRKGTYISYSTLSRIFGLAKTKTNPRQKTLDELCLFLGYPNFNAFIESNEIENNLESYPFEMQIEFEAALEMNNVKEASKLFLEIVQLNNSSSFLAKDLSRKLHGNYDLNKQYLKKLADNRLGRDFFFLKFIDEDDVYGGYGKSISEIFKQNADLIETEFIELYQSRKAIMEMGSKNSHFNWDWLCQDSSNIHHQSRKIELRLIRNRHEKTKTKVIHVEQIITDTLKSFKNCKNSQEEIALIGRFCRGVLLSQSEYIIKQHHQICQLIFEMLNHQLTDFEFQFPMYCILNRIGISKPLSIPSSASWPNAYFTSTYLFDKSQSSSRLNQFYIENLRIHPEYFI